MDELQISGRRYISSRRIAKENGYHTDYIGQLIRGGKIKGQKVGRTWYVDAASFAAYLGETPQELPPQAAAESILASGQFAPQIPTPAPELQPIPATHPTEMSEPVPPAPRTFAPGMIPSAPLTHAQSTPITTASAPTQPVQPKVREENGLASPAIKAQPDLQDEENRGSFTHAPSAEHQISLRKVAQPQGGLRYAKEPLLPEIPRSERITRAMPTFERPVAVVSAPAGLPTVRSTRGRTLGLIAAAGVVVFVFSAVMSSGLLQTITIKAGNSASVGYALRW